MFQVIYAQHYLLPGCLPRMGDLSRGADVLLPMAVADPDTDPVEVAAIYMSM